MHVCVAWYAFADQLVTQRLNTQASQVAAMMHPLTHPPVWNVALLGGQSTDDVSQGRQ